MRSIVALLSLSIFLSSCSLYRSEGRKQFEADAPGHLAANSFKLVQCQNLNAVETWFHQEFNRNTYELITSEDRLEVWAEPLPHYVEVKTFSKSDLGIMNCTYHFANDATWNSHKNQFIHDLKQSLNGVE